MSELVSNYVSLYWPPLLFRLGLVLVATALIMAVILVWRKRGRLPGALTLFAMAFVALFFLDIATAGLVDSIREWPTKYRLAKLLSIDPGSYPTPPGFERFPASEFRNQVQIGQTSDEVVASLEHVRARYRCNLKYFAGYSERYTFLSEDENSNHLSVYYDNGDRVVGVNIGPRDDYGSSGSSLLRPSPRSSECRRL
jgi:hypothetical protein